MFTTGGSTAIDVPVAEETEIATEGATLINMVVSTDIAGTGALDIYAQIGSGGAWFDTGQSFDLATEMDAITAITGAPYTKIKLVPNVIATATTYSAYLSKA